MNPLNNLPKATKELIIAAYEIGYWDRDAKLAHFNNASTETEKLDYINLQLNPFEDEEPNICKKL